MANSVAQEQSIRHSSLSYWSDFMGMSLVIRVQCSQTEISVITLFWDVPTTVTPEEVITAKVPW